MKKALIVVDVQRDFCEGGLLAVGGGEKVAEDIAAYLASDPDYDLVVATEDWHIDPGDHFSTTPDYVNTWPPHCIAGSSGARLHKAIRDSESPDWFDEHFRKGLFSAAYSGFEGASDLNATPLGEWLDRRGVTDVDICGIATDYCVKATALDAMELGFITTVLVPLTAAVSEHGRELALDEMIAAGIYLR